MRGERAPEHLSFSGDGQYLAGAVGKNILLWDTDEWNIKKRLYGHTQQITAMTLRPDGRFLATSGLDGKVIFWDLKRGKVVRSFVPHESGVSAICFDEEGRYLATAGLDKMVKIWDVSVLDLLTQKMKGTN